MFSKGFLCLMLIGCALAQDYSDDQTAREQQLAPNYARQGYNNDIYETSRSEPYDFGFQSTDEFGTIMNRQESSDNNGAVRGSYGYTDPFGVFRHVDYVADEYGFRAEVKSNEPGMGTQSPANVQIYAEPPPAGVIVERPYYHPHNLGQGAQAGQAVGQQASRRNPSSSASSNANRQVRPVSSGARIASTNSGSRTAIYPYVQPQQNAFSNNALSGSQYAPSTSNQYPSSSNQYPSNSNQYASNSNQYSSNSNQYPATVSSQYAANTAAASTSTSTGSQYATGTAYQASAASVYPARNPYGSQGYAGLATSHLATGRSANTEQPIVPKPYDGPTYKIGNPHVTEYTRADKEKSGTYLLPTVVATGGGPTTLVKHIHTYPAAPAA